MFALLLIVFTVLTSSFFTTEANAVCNDRSVCKHIRYCAYENLTWGNERIEDLRNNLRTDNAREVRAQVNYCQSTVGNSDWFDVSGTCSDGDIINIGRRARSNQCDALGDGGGPVPAPAPRRCMICRVDGTNCQMNQAQPEGQGCGCGGKSGVVWCP